MQHIELPVSKYVGVDIVPSVIESNRQRFARPGVEFEVRDLTRDPLPKADLILCRDLLVHLSFLDIAAVLRNFKQTGATYILLNTYPHAGVNRDQFTGGSWRFLDMTLAPFHFPPPLELFADGGDIDPNMLGLWELTKLSAFAGTAAQHGPRS